MSLACTGLLPPQIVFCWLADYRKATGRVCRGISGGLPVKALRPAWPISSSTSLSGVICCKDPGKSQSSSALLQLSQGWPQAWTWLTVSADLYLAVSPNTAPLLTAAARCLVQFLTITNLASVPKSTLHGLEISI